MRMKRALKILLRSLYLRVGNKRYMSDIENVFKKI